MIIRLPFNRSVLALLIVSLISLLSFASKAYAIDPDSDTDTVIDIVDNCTLVVNTAQRDTDNDGFGNFCDPDLTNNNLVDSLDIGKMMSVFLTTDPDADLNSDVVVDRNDLAILVPYLNNTPGPASQVIFVASAGSNSNSGTRSAPMQTINAAISRAASRWPTANIAIMEGVYVGPVSLTSGISLYGGFDFSWNRNVAAYISRATGANPVIYGDGASNLKVDGMTITASSTSSPGQSSYAVKLTNASNIIFSDNTIESGNGGGGIAGSNGSGGAGALVGNTGYPGSCDSLRGLGGSGGYSACGKSGGNGGAGGSDSGCYYGGVGGVGISGTAGGSGGSYGRYNISFTSCSGDSSGNAGQTGNNGTSGFIGSSGNGGNGGWVSGMNWISSNGINGFNGGHGNGGGGGGGGGSQCGTCVDDGGGNGAGGGGGGGCGGYKGIGGNGGGGSFAFFLVQVSPIEISGNSIQPGNGGGGGNGGNGGAGGNGADGGFGAAACISEVGRGGNGGRGGRGGDGGDGGGGAGGPSIGIAKDTSTSLTLSGNIFLLGTQGAGGFPNGSLGQQANVLTF